VARSDLLIAESTPGFARREVLDSDFAAVFFPTEFWAAGNASRFCSSPPTGFVETESIEVLVSVAIDRSFRVAG